MAGPRLFDGFTINDELDLLEIRLHELWEVTHRFVVVEADRNFAGQPKPLHFADNGARFAPFADKIIHVAVRDMPGGANPWPREAHQRDAIARGFADALPGDYLGVSDVDEIPSRAAIEALRRDGPAIWGLQQRFCYFRLNYMNIAGPEAVRVWAAGWRLGQARLTPQGLRQRRGRMEKGRLRGARVMRDAGWHFSWLGGREAALRKLAAFSHQELNRPEVAAALEPERILEQCLDPFGRAGFVWASLPAGAAGGLRLPRLVEEQPARFAHLLSPHGARDAERVARMVMGAAAAPARRRGWLDRLLGRS